ncbi:MAG: hypothetical protein IPH60_14875 [Flavobacteriales bacterium]|nr:hypothetical protein [Flavobacteriales bacterium]
MAAQFRGMAFVLLVALLVRGNQVRQLLDFLAGDDSRLVPLMLDSGNELGENQTQEDPMMDDQNAVFIPSRSVGMLASMSSTLNLSSPAAIPRKVPNTPSVENTQVWSQDVEIDLVDIDPPL